MAPIGESTGRSRCRTINFDGWLHPFTYLKSSRAHLSSIVNMGIETMIGIGFVWGATNAFMKRGALISEKVQRQRKSYSSSKRGLVAEWILRYIEDWIRLLCIWQYSIPFLINLSASAGFFVILGDNPISIAVPVTNAVTFAATAATGLVLGERMDFLHTLVGFVLIVAGIWLCIDSAPQ